MFAVVLFSDNESGATKASQHSVHTDERGEVKGAKKIGNMLMGGSEKATTLLSDVSNIFFYGLYLGSLSDMLNESSIFPFSLF
jgi:hypothetical protein